MKRTTNFSLIDNEYNYKTSDEKKFKASKKVTIAIICDNLETSRLLKNILCEYKIILYSNVEELLVDLEMKLIDLVVVKCTFYENECPSIKEHMLKQNLELPIIYIPESEVNWKCLREGVDDVLKKPFDSRELIYRVKGIIERKKIEFTDELTGAYNRKFLKKRFEEEKKLHKKSRKVLSVVFLDLDNFKKINDNYGHSFGDKILKDFVETINISLKNYGEVFRYGGDEFILLLPDTTDKKALKIAEDIRTSIKNKDYLVDGKRYSLKISFCAGIATMDSYDLSITELLKKADDELYILKDGSKII